MIKNYYLVCDSLDNAPVVALEFDGVVTLSSCLRYADLYWLSFLFEGLQQPIVFDSVSGARYFKHSLERLTNEDYFVLRVSVNNFTVKCKIMDSALDSVSYSLIALRDRYSFKFSPLL